MDHCDLDEGKPTGTIVLVGKVWLHKRSSRREEEEMMKSRTIFTKLWFLLLNTQLNA